jgi:hypothetical protein
MGSSKVSGLCMQLPLASGWHSKIDSKCMSSQHASSKIEMAGNRMYKRPDDANSNRSSL